MPGNTYICTCSKGFTGRYCQVAATSCSDSPCQNGATCAEIGGVFLCTCLQGWTGTTCDIEINPCDKVHCFNGQFIPIVSEIFFLKKKILTGKYKSHSSG